MIKEVLIKKTTNGFWIVTDCNKTVFTTNVYDKAKEKLIEIKREKFKKDYPFKRKVFKKNKTNR